jgi:hypothetical protein
VHKTVEGKKLLTFVMRPMARERRMIPSTALMIVLIRP